MPHSTILATRVLDSQVSRTLSKMINESAAACMYSVYDLFDDAKLIAKLAPSEPLTLKVNPSGVRMVKIVPQKNEDGPPLPVQYEQSYEQE